MILIEIGVQDGLNEYNFWHYLEDYTEDDYDKKKLQIEKSYQNFFTQTIQMKITLTKIVNNTGTIQVLYGLMDCEK